MVDSLQRTRDRDARIAGFLYLIFVFIGLFGLMYVPNVIVQTGDAVATAHNIVGHESLVRLWIVADVLGGTWGLLVALALYRLFNSVDRTQAILLLILGGLMPVPLYYLMGTFSAGALVAAQGHNFMAVFAEPQRDAIAMLLLRLRHYDLMTSFIFAGLWLFPFGVLVYKSGFLPRILGVWLFINGFPYIIIALTDFLAPQYNGIVGTASQPILFGEIAIMLWLLIMGARPGFRRPNNSSRISIS